MQPILKSSHMEPLIILDHGIYFLCTDSYICLNSYFFSIWQVDAYLTL